ncbi:unnamed protein product [Amoebophrya sp. A120]|nr:unnamed protein product [Amoebophrya sp. A120]|eukprot:GSA120T00019660001.1
MRISSIFSAAPTPYSDSSSARERGANVGELLRVVGPSSSPSSSSAKVAEKSCSPRPSSSISQADMEMAWLKTLVNLLNKSDRFVYPNPRASGVLHDKFGWRPIGSVLIGNLDRG